MLASPLVNLPAWCMTSNKNRKDKWVPPNPEGETKVLFSLWSFLSKVHLYTSHKREKEWILEYEHINKSPPLENDQDSLVKEE